MNGFFIWLAGCFLKNEYRDLPCPAIEIVKPAACRLTSTELFEIMRYGSVSSRRTAVGMLFFGSIFVRAFYA